MSDYEPPAEQIEALVADWHAFFGYDPSEAAIRFVLRRQHERESGLLEALRHYLCQPGSTVAAHALAAHAKLDAPKVPEAPTLLEAAKAVIKNSAAPFAAFDALKAAVEREEKR